MDKLYRDEWRIQIRDLWNLKRLVGNADLAFSLIAVSVSMNRFPKSIGSSWFQTHKNTKSFIQFCIVQKIKLEINNQPWLVPDIINNKLFTRYDTYVEFSRGISVMMIAVGILGLIGNITAIIVLSRWIVCTRFDVTISFLTKKVTDVVLIVIISLDGEVDNDIRKDDLGV